MAAPAKKMDATAASDAAGWKALTKTYSQVQFNEARSAVQLIDCKGQVIAHVPVEATVARVLAE